MRFFCIFRFSTNRTSSDVVYLDDRVGGVASKENIEFFSDDVTWSKLPTSKQYAQKEGYRFFMEKDL